MSTCKPPPPSTMVALPLCTTVRPPYTRVALRFGASISETAMRLDLRGVHPVPQSRVWGNRHRKSPSEADRSGPWIRIQGPGGGGRNEGRMCTQSMASAQSPAIFSQSSRPGVSSRKPPGQWPYGRSLAQACSREHREKVILILKKLKSTGRCMHGPLFFVRNICPCKVERPE